MLLRSLRGCVLLTLLPFVIARPTRAALGEEPFVRFCNRTRHTRARARWRHRAAPRRYLRLARRLRARATCKPTLNACPATNPRSSTPLLLPRLPPSHRLPRPQPAHRRSRAPRETRRARDRGQMGIVDARSRRSAAARRPRAARDRRQRQAQARSTGIYDLRRTSACLRGIGGRRATDTTTPFFIQPGRQVTAKPSVKYRGIFLNDEAPIQTGARKIRHGGRQRIIPPWPAGIANFGHQFYEKISRVSISATSSLIAHI